MWISLQLKQNLLTKLQAHMILLVNYNKCLKQEQNLLYVVSSTKQRKEPFSTHFLRPTLPWYQTKNNIARKIYNGVWHQLHQIGSANR